MTITSTTNIEEQKEEILKFIDSKIELYTQFRTILYTQIDTVHYSPQNTEIFKLISEITIRMDELYQLNMRLGNNDDKIKW